MKQWDALHAMILYVTIELQNSLRDIGENWKPRPRALGLRLPFIRKVSRCLSGSGSVLIVIQSIHSVAPC
jgi:hypothetical protein